MQEAKTFWSEATIFWLPPTWLTTPTPPARPPIAIRTLTGIYAQNVYFIEDFKVLAGVGVLLGGGAGGGWRHFRPKQRQHPPAPPPKTTPTPTGTKIWQHTKPSLRRNPSGQKAKIFWLPLTLTHH
ncbi:hypothetical protein QE152_g8986 [Popillia japonica]|uniref:Uncharacterized protein n=1 Tax=Popillia japonica TaxID=7064 RepID=A0AAW1LWJ3_POPJA